MSLRKHIFLLVSGGICLVLLVAATMFLLKGRTSYAAVDGDLQTALTRLDRLQKRSPYPSRENVARVRKHHEALSRFLADWVGDLRKGQMEPESMEAAAFKKVMEKTINDLYAEADERMLLPERFAFGFDKYYVEGAFPKDADISRLTIQLKTIQRLFGLLRESKVTELVSIERDRFDERHVSELEARLHEGMVVDAVETAQKLGAPGEEDSDLYDRERYTIKVVSPEDAFWDLLDALSQSSLFAVVRDVQLLNETHAAGFAMPGMKPRPGRPGAGRPGAGLAMEDLSRVYEPIEGFGPRARAVARPPEGEAQDLLPEAHDERIVAGREMLTAEITLDVYRFAATAEKGEGGS
jgi:hypothetical protein